MFRIAGKAVGGFRVAGKIAGGLRVAGQTLLFAMPDEVYTISRTLDRSFGVTPASGGGNVEPDTFDRSGDSWELWQCIPNLGPGIATNGDCRIQLRDRSRGRNQMQLDEMPDQVRIIRDGWTDSPWTFNRPTSNSKFSNVGSGSSGRKGIDYEPIGRTLRLPADDGIVQGQTFTVELIWKA